jgi:pyridoxal phosphate enzyme (YggS family)
LDHLREQIRNAAHRSGRDEAAVQLMAVTKTVGVERLNDALRLGVGLLGENRVQEAAAKKPHLSAGPFELHLIGPLQTNKARKAIELFDVIQSVDRRKIADALNRLAMELGIKKRCLVEVKISSEPNKTGVPITEAADFVRGFTSYTNLILDGVMTIGELGVSAEETRAGFRAMKTFFDAHRNCFSERAVLSMGMTDDFEIAIEEGATLVRIGRGLFGERNHAQR